VVNLAVSIGKLKLKNPVMVASGTWGIEYKDLADIDKLGAIVLKTITLKARTGNPPPRVAETSSGMLNSIGLENTGLDDFLKNKLPLFNSAKTRLVVSIAGDDEAEFKELARRISKAKRADALELNLSCPNIHYGLNKGIIAHDEKAIYRVVKAARGATGLAVIAKLSPNVTDIAAMAKAAESAGADAVAIANTFIGMAVDIDTRRPKIGNVVGGLSGPAIKPLALRTVWQAYKEIKIPIIGIGGIMDYKDAIEFMLCGARAVQFGTANFVDPQAPAAAVKGIAAYMKRSGMKNTNALVGAIKSG